jgi:hypothetical protein
MHGQGASFFDEFTFFRGFFMVSCIVPSSPRWVSQETVQRTRCREADAKQRRSRTASRQPPLTTPNPPVPRRRQVRIEPTSTPVPTRSRAVDCESHADSSTGRPRPVYQSPRRHAKEHA